MRSLALLLGALLLCSPALAQTLEIPLGQQGDAVAGLPQLGESKRSVLERFAWPTRSTRPWASRPSPAGTTAASASISNTTM